MTKSWHAWQEQKRRRLKEQDPEKYAEACRRLETRRRFKRSMREYETRKTAKDGGRDLFGGDSPLPSCTDDEEHVEDLEDVEGEWRYSRYQNRDEHAVYPDGIDDRHVFKYRFYAGSVTPQDELVHEAFTVDETTAHASEELVHRRTFRFKGAANAQSSQEIRDSPVRANANGKRARAETEDSAEDRLAQSPKRRRRTNPPNNRQPSPGLDPANSQLVLRSTQFVVSTQDLEEAPRGQGRSLITTKYGGDWPHLRRGDKFSRMSAAEQKTTLQNWMAEVNEYADAIEAPAIPAPLMKRFFRRVQSHINGTMKRLPVDHLDMADVRAAYQEETNTWEDLVAGRSGFIQDDA